MFQCYSRVCVGLAVVDSTYYIDDNSEGRTFIALTIDTIVSNTARSTIRATACVAYRL